MAGQIAELSKRTLKRDFRSHQHQARAGDPARRRAARCCRRSARSSARRPRTPSRSSASRSSSARWSPTSTSAGWWSRTRTAPSAASRRSPRSGRPACRPARSGETLAEQSGAALDRAGRIGVNPDLTLPGYPEVFVVGDMIALNNLPGVAQVAIQGAKYAAKEIKGRLKDKPPQKPFKYFDKGSMATISRFDAVAMVGKLRISGFDRLADVARRPPDLPDRLQEPGDRAAALDGHVPEQRPLRAHRHRAADLRADGAQAAARAAPPELVSDPGASRTAGPSSRRSPPRRPGSPTPASADASPTAPPDPAPRHAARRHLQCRVRRHVTV